MKIDNCKSNELKQTNCILVFIRHNRQFLIMKPNLRVNTVDVQSSPEYSSAASRSEIVSSPLSSYQFMTAYTRFENREGRTCRHEGETSRSIHRTFAFDEWDDEETAMNQATEALVRSSIGTNRANRDEGRTDHTEGYQDSQRIIQRSFAFDEWDDELSGSMVEEKKNECFFRPIPNRQTGEDATNTKFDIDNKFTTAITPSPIPNKIARAECPLPVYPFPFAERGTSQLLDVAQTPRYPFPQLNWDRDPTSIPTSSGVDDYNSLEFMFQQQQQDSKSLSLLCESIPRRASAFRTVTPANVHSLDYVSHSCDLHSLDPNGMIYGRGPTALFHAEDNDQVVQSPSRSCTPEEIHAVPEFIICYKSD